MSVHHAGAEGRVVAELGVTRSSIASVFAAIAILAILASGCGGEDGDANPAQQLPPGDAVEGRGPAGGGESSIEEFGEEAGGSDREAILASFETYLVALAKRDYAGACSLLSATAGHSLEQFVPRSSKTLGCPEILPKLLTPAAAAIAREQAGGKVTKVRVEGDRGFVVFRAPGADLYQMTMVREGGRWRPTTLAASVLVPSL